MLFLLILGNEFHISTYAEAQEAIPICRYNKEVTAAVSVDTPAFIAIGRSCLEGCGFDSHCRSGSFLRFNYRPVIHGAVGSLASSGILGPSTWVHFPLEPLDLIV